MEVLEKYFRLFDEARTNTIAREELNNLFTRDICFVLNGVEKNGIDQWEIFLDLIFKNNLDIKHMYEGWNFIEEKNLYETRWAVCGKRKDKSVYTQTGKDIASLDENGKIKYLENVPDNTDLFERYK
ncbi:MAG: hypothetical protein Q4B63_09210 [Clostridium perfringens]|nr:hypothetical protein [Clostridium perfringens]